MPRSTPGDDAHAPSTAAALDGHPLVRSIRRCLGTAALLTVLTAAPAFASTHVWTGPAGGSWSSAANWTGGLPTTGEPGGTIVQFGSSTSSVMNIAGLTVDEIHFTGTGNSIGASGGTPLAITGSTVTNNIVDDAGTNSIVAPLTLTGSTVFTTVAAGTLTLSGAVGGTTGLRVTGTGGAGVTLAATANSYTGTTTVAAGTLGLNSPGVNSAIVGPSIVIGVPGGGAATLRLFQALEIAATTDVQVTSVGTFDVNSFAQAIDALTVSDGAVTIAGGGLLVGGTLTMAGGTISSTTGMLRLGADVSATSSAAGTATITGAVTLNGARTFTVADGPQATDLSIAGVIGDGTAPGSSLAKAGTGVLSISGTSANTYTGATSIQRGILATTHSAGVGIPGSVTIGTGSGGAASATLRLDQSGELASSANVQVQADGRFDVGTHVQTVGALTIQDGAVSITTGSLTVTGALGMTGGSIASAATGALLVGANVTATSSATGPATISARELLTGDRTYTVTPGTSPELVLSGVVADSGGARAITKAGGGTLLTTAADTYTGLTTVAAGRLVVRGQQPGPVTVAAGATLAGNGQVGATSVAGVLAPEAGLRTGPLSFGATGQLTVAIASADPALAAVTTVTGAVTVDPAARLSVTVAPGLTLPGGRAFPLLANDAGDAVSGAFAPSAIVSPEGVPLVPIYTAIDGNDLALTATNVAPAVGAIVVAPATAAVGQPVALTVASSDLNNDTLTTTWDFGDGTQGSTASTSHVYASDGTYHVVATVSDGIAPTTAGATVTVTGPTKFPSHETPLTGPGSVKATAFGATFTLTAPRACVKAGAGYTAALTVKRIKDTRYQIARVRRVAFSAAGQKTRSDVSAPFAAGLKLPPATKAGTTAQVTATATLRLRNGKLRTKTLKLVVRACG